MRNILAVRLTEGLARIFSSTNAISLIIGPRIAASAIQPARSIIFTALTSLRGSLQGCRLSYSAAKSAHSD